MSASAAACNTTALLLHGLCSTPDELLPVQAALRQAGHRVLPLTVPGYTFETTAARQQSAPFAQWLETVAAVVRAQRGEGRRVVVVGLSAGATLALGAAMLPGAAPDGLVLMSTTLVYDGWSIPPWHWLMPLALYTPLGRFWRYRERPPYGVKNPRVRRWIEQELATRRVSRAGAAVIEVPHLREHDRLRRRVLRGLSGFACPPVLALHARDDEVAGPRNLKILESRLDSQAFRALWLEDSHHMITIDNDRQLVARATVQFVDTVASGSAHAPLAEGVPTHAQDHDHDHV